MSGVMMRFSGVSFSHNPKTLKISGSKRISSVELIGGKKRLSSVCGNISKISGTGELYGESCFLSYDRLLRMSLSNQSGILAVPELGAFRAVLSDISIAAEPKSNFLEISFEFQAVGDGREPEKILPSKYYAAEKGDSFWDVSFKYGVTVERLVEINPQIRNIMDLSKGERVRVY